ncbi:putative reverse transcriptase domain-containing protein, partial [Tanacetum coccineum]
KCRLHHVGPCTVKCTNCKKTGHMARDCKSQAATTNQRAPVYNQRTPLNIRELQWPTRGRVSPVLSVEDKAIIAMTAQN